MRKLTTLPQQLQFLCVWTFSFTGLVLWTPIDPTTKKQNAIYARGNIHHVLLGLNKKMLYLFQIGKNIFDIASHDVGLTILDAQCNV